MGSTVAKPLRRYSTTKGFKNASALLSRQIRDVGETRGFAVSRVLTHWAEIAGPEIAAHTRPVEVKYGRQGLGATLTVLTTGAYAPMIEMQKDRLRERVNACYGYAAVSAIRVTQTAATGFAEGRAQFTPAPKAEPASPSPAASRDAREMAAPVANDALRVALADLGANILTKSNHSKGQR